MYDFPTSALNPQSPCEDQTTKGQGNPDSPGLASPVLVQHAAGPFGGHPAAAGSLAGSAVPEPQQFSATKLGGVAPDCLAATWLNADEQECLARLQQFLLGSRKSNLPGQIEKVHVLGLRLGHPARTGFTAGNFGLSSAFQAPGPVLSSIKMHLVAISAFHRLSQGRSVFTHNMTVWFLKGL